MASCEEQLLCSICLEVFKEPVTTPCGHNYCKACITAYWLSSPQTRCPLCKKRFKQRPALRCNTSFRDVLEHLRSLSLLSPTEEQQAGPGDVSCDICLEPKHKAIKTCVVCVPSYCYLHLEPHQRVPSLKKHQLTDPLPDLDHRVCWQHGKILQFFCTTDQMCICHMCIDDVHNSHQYIPLEQAFKAERESIQHGIANLTTMENIKLRDIAYIRSHIDQSKKKKDIDVADVEKVFTALIDSLNRDKERLIQIMEQKYKDALKEPEDRVCQLQKRVIEIQQKRAQLEEAVQIEDQLQLLQHKPELPEQHHEDLLMQFDFDDEEPYSGIVKPAVEEMEDILIEEMDKLIHKVQDNEDGIETALQIWIPPKDQLMMIQQNHAVDLTFDPYSAHLFLSVFKRDKAFMNNPLIPNQPQSWFFQRHFQYYPFVLSTDGFCCGRFYFEVQVGGAVEWILGVVRENFNRNMMFKHLPSPTDGAWILCTLNKGGGLSYFNYTRPNKVGVFVDYEKAEVSFYDVDARVLITSFRECTFNEPVSFLKSALYSLAGVNTNKRVKLYPIFGVFKYFDSLEITPINTTF